jgi:xylulokinase
VGSQWWSSLDEAVGTLRITGRVSPDTALGPLYQVRFNTFRTLYDALRPVFAQIAAETAAVARQPII